MSKASKKTKPAPYVAPVLTWQEHREYTVRNWTSTRDRAAKLLKEFAEGVTGDNPYYAMEWANNAFTEAATHKVFATLLRIAERAEIETADQFIEAARSYAEDAIRDALQTSSTSPTCNLAKQRLGECWRHALSSNWGAGVESAAKKMYPPVASDASDTSVMAGG